MRRSDWGEGKGSEGGKVRRRMEAEGMCEDVCATLAAAASSRNESGGGIVAELRAHAGERQAQAVARRERARELRLEAFLLDRLLRLVTVVLEPDLDLRGGGIKSNLTLKTLVRVFERNYRVSQKSIFDNTAAIFFHGHDLGALNPA